MSEPAATLTEVPHPPQPRAAARQLWIERLACFRASGLRPPAFCAAEGISRPSFYFWKRRLAAESRSPDTPTMADAAPGPRLLPVRLASSPAPLEVVLPSGAVLRIPPGSDLTFVRSLVQSLGERPC